MDGVPEFIEYVASKLNGLELTGKQGIELMERVLVRVRVDVTQEDSDYMMYLLDTLKLVINRSR